MRNFGSDSFVSQHHYHHLHHQLVPPSPLPPSMSIHQQLTGIPPAIKLEPYQLTKAVGVGTNTNLNKQQQQQQPNKSHFSPVNMVAPSQHDHHYGGVGHHNSSAGTNGRDGVASAANNNNVAGIPINLSHPHQHPYPHPHPLHGSIVGSSPASTVESHSPTAALAAACPTSANRGPSPAHHQQIPVSSSPYHPSHSPTLPAAHTALPSEMHGSTGPSSTTSVGGTSNRSSPPTQVSLDASTPAPTPAYHLAPVTSFNRIQSHNNAMNSKIGKSVGGGDHVTTNHSSSPANSNPAHHGSSSTVKSETTPSLPPTPAPSSVGSNSPTNGNSAPTSSGGTGTTSASATAARIVSQNVNGTLAITGIPTNESELQLFRVLQRANLLSYFDMMIELGGDDVQQLCEAGEEEFLEIMALIGMAAKPLHVRRLQKALQEWMTQPSLFQSPVLPPGFQHPYGVSQIDHTISHTQYTTTVGGTTTPASNVPGGVGHHNHPHHPVPVIPLPHLISHNPISPYPAQSAPIYAVEPKSHPSETSSKTESQSKNSKSVTHHHHHLAHDRSNSNVSPSLTNGLTTSSAVGAGLHGPYMQQGSPLIPVVISTGQTYNSGQGAAPVQQSSNISTCSTVTADSFRNCVSPSGSTTSSSSTVSIRSHHHQFHPQAPSPMENFPSSPANSESSGRSCSSTTTTKNKQEEQPTTSTELENESSFDQTNSSQSLDNSAGTGRVALSSNSSSRSGSSCGSEPSSPRPPGPTISSSFSKGGMLISSNQIVVDSPRSSSESVTNRNNNSVTFPSSSSSSSAQQAQDFSQLQEHEIQKLAETAMHLVRSLPVHVKEPRLSRKIETSSYEFVLRLADDDPRKMEEIRRLSTIFGKASNGDTTSSKRSKGNGSKSVSVLELAMNEAAAQLCRLVPALLTKRDEMYSLARQVIRDSGLPYAVICANSNLPSSFYNNNNNNNNIEVGERTKGKIDEIRNSPAHEERISNEFAAACKKIKLDIRGVGVQEINGYHGPRKNSLSHTTENGMHITEIHNIPRRKSPSRESNHVTASALKKMALVASEFRNNSSKSSSLSIRT